jgi:hypothetical protein
MILNTHCHCSTFYTKYVLKKYTLEFRTSKENRYEEKITDQTTHTSTICTQYQVLLAACYKAAIANTRLLFPSILRGQLYSILHYLSFFFIHSVFAAPPPNFATLGDRLIFAGVKPAVILLMYTCVINSCTFEPCKDLLNTSVPILTKIIYISVSFNYWPNLSLSLFVCISNYPSICLIHPSFSLHEFIFSPIYLNVSKLAIFYRASNKLITY